MRKFISLLLSVVLLFGLISISPDFEEKALAENVINPMVSGGISYTISLKNDGTVWAWGDNYDGQLGDGTTKNRDTPVQVNSLTGIIQISAGNFHNIALKHDGTVWAWGFNYNGQLGDGTKTKKSTPVQISGLSGIIQISAGGFIPSH